VSDSDLAQLAPTGSMGGYFTYEDVWAIHSSLHKKYPEFVTAAKKFGKTWLKDDMLAFKIGNEIRHRRTRPKHEILFNALHHSREQTSLTTLVMTFIENLRRIVHKDPIFNVIQIGFIPVVNVDSFRLINKSWKTPNWNSARILRKNRHSYGKCSTWNSGVDLNRNYGYKFGYGDKQGGSDDPCQEDYRGPKPFSEPETVNMKKFIEQNPKIKSSMNFHAFGDLFIYPYNYLKDNFDKVLGAEKPKLLAAYQEIERDAPAPVGAIWGNAAKAINYIANGEASDWMMHYHDILAYSPEIGNHDKFSEHFYVTDIKNHLPTIIQNFYPTVRFFIDMHKISFKVESVKRIGNKIQLQLFYGGLSIVEGVTLMFKLKDQNYSVKILSMDMQSGDKPFVSGRLRRRLAGATGKMTTGGRTAVVGGNLDRRSYVMLNLEISGGAADVEYELSVYKSASEPVWSASGKV